MLTATLLAAVSLAATPAPADTDAVFAPFRLPTVDGAAIVDLRDLRGKKVLLIDFASW